MNLLEKKQLNLLAHLARVDGKFENAERELLQVFMKKKGLNKDALRDNRPVDINYFAKSNNKTELLHWALRMMHADGIVHTREIAFCKNLAIKLGFQEEIIEYFTSHRVPEFTAFERRIKAILEG